MTRKQTPTLQLWSLVRIRPLFNLPEAPSRIEGIMSNLRHHYPLDHRVFQGGRYLRAFDHAPDIDHYEHSILTFLGSLMPFDKQFLDHPAWPAVASIANSTKISASTVRKKIRSLEQKGYLRTEAIRLLNKRGHFEQSSNNYMLSPLAFDFFESVLTSEAQIAGIRKRAVGESLAPDEAPPVPREGGSFAQDSGPRSETAPNSLPKPSEEDISNPSSSATRDIFTMKGEVDRIAAAWEELLKVPVANGEKARFLREYVRCRGNEIFYMERLLIVASDPYICSRAKSINFLFSSLDCALKNKAEIVEKAGHALKRTETEHELNQVLEAIPEYMEKKSQQFGRATSDLVHHLLQAPINEAKGRLGIAVAPPLPRNACELREEIQRLLGTDLSDSQRNELTVIFDALSRLDFGYCLTLFERFRSKSAE